MDKVTEVKLAWMRGAGVQGMWRLCAGGDTVAVRVRGRGVMFGVRLNLGAPVRECSTTWSWSCFRDATIAELDTVLDKGALLVTADSVPRFVVERWSDDNE